MSLVMSELPDIENLYRLDGKVCIVTGASSGFGDRFARVLSAAGAKVVVAARRRDRLDELVAELPDALAIQCDVSSDDECKKLIDESIARYGRVDVLVNNAGITDAVHPAEEANIDLFRKVVDVNLNSCFLLSALATPLGNRIKKITPTVLSTNQITPLTSSCPLVYCSSPCACRTHSLGS